MGTTFSQQLSKETKVSATNLSPNGIDEFCNGCTDSPSSKKFKTLHTSADKVMLLFPFDRKGTLLDDFQERGTTFNAQRWFETLTKLMKANKSKRPGKLYLDVIMLYDNARLHTAKAKKELLQKFK